MKTLSFKSFLLKSIRIMLVFHVFLSVVLTAPVTQSLPILATEGDDVPQKHSHHSRHTSTMSGSASNLREIEKEQANHERELATENSSPSISSDANGLLKERPMVNQTFSLSTSAHRKEDEDALRRLLFSPRRNESVSKKESKKLSSNQKDVRDPSNRSILKGTTTLPNQPGDNLDDYYVLNEEEGEARPSTAMLNPDVQLLLQKNKESSHFDSIPDYSHLEFPKDATEAQFGKGMPRQHFKQEHRPRILIRLPVDTVGTRGPLTHTRTSTTWRPISKGTVPSETKILVNEYVIPQEPDFKERNGTLGVRWYQGTDIRDDSIPKKFVFSGTAYRKSSNDEAKKVTGPTEAERIKFFPNKMESKTLENRPKAKDERKTTKETPMNSGLDTVMDYPLDYLALEDQELKELETMKIQTTVKIQKQSTVNSTPVISTGTPKIQNSTVSSLTTTSPLRNRTGPQESQSLILEKSQTISAIQNSSILLVGLPKLETDLGLTDDTTKMTNLFGEKLIEEFEDSDSDSDSEETESVNRQPVKSQHMQVSDKHVPGNNSTNTGSTKIDIYLEIRTPSQPNPSSSEQGQGYSVVPIGKGHTHHDHNHKYARMATETDNF